MPPPRKMSDSARYTRTSNYSDGSVSSRSQSSTEEADDSGIPESSPPPRTRNRRNRKNSPTPPLATISDYGDKTKEGANAPPTAKAASEATPVPAPATATPTQPALTHNSSRRSTRNTPATNVGSTCKAKSPSRPLTTLYKKPQYRKSKPKQFVRA